MLNLLDVSQKGILEKERDSQHLRSYLLGPVFGRTDFCYFLWSAPARHDFRRVTLGVSQRGPAKSQIFFSGEKSVLLRVLCRGVAKGRRHIQAVFPTSPWGAPTGRSAKSCLAPLCFTQWKALCTRRAVLARAVSRQDGFHKVWSNPAMLRIGHLSKFMFIIFQLWPKAESRLQSHVWQWPIWATGFFRGFAAGFLLLIVGNFRRSREGWNCRFQKTPRTEDADKVPAGLPFPVPEILEFVASRDSGNIFQRFSPEFPEFSSGTPEHPSHLRPVILKPVGRIFEMSDSNPIQGKCGKCGRPSHPRKTRVWGDSVERKSGKRGKCGRGNVENAENADDWLQCDWL